jgi:putative protease
MAMNSLMREEEVGQAVEVLGALDALQPDALIMQALGIYHIARRYFPRLRLHASTLMGAHNSMAVRQFSEMGFKRVVLAREMTIEEIGQFSRQSDVELEVFVHGALCFSYSGLCLFSSYLGGKSGLRGRCVQPCRRRYTWGGKGKKSPAGYLFSMNDLSGLDLIPHLQQAGVSSLKIEGRMRSAQYVSSVVRAYRQVLDAPGDDKALADAEDILSMAMGRKPSPGYFLGGQPDNLIVPQHSGNVGIFLGKIEKFAKGMATLNLKEKVRCGDRLRVHQEKSGDRQGFTLKELLVKNQPVKRADGGSSVSLMMPQGVKIGDSLFKVDVVGRSQKVAKGKGGNPARYVKQVQSLTEKAYMQQIVHNLLGRSKRVPFGKKQDERKGRKPSAGRGKGRRGHDLKLPVEWWLKVDNLEFLKQHPPTPPARVVITLTRETYGQLARYKKRLVSYQRRLTWALPPIILEDDLAFYREAISSLQKRGFHAWQLGHISQRLFFDMSYLDEKVVIAHTRKGREPKVGPRPTAAKLRLFCDFTVNVLNSVSMRTLASLGILGGQLAIETDRANLIDFCSHKSEIPVGLTVYAQPPLFTSRLAPKFFNYDQPLISPKGEVIILKQRWGQTIAVAQHPFSLLPFLAEIAAQGVKYVVVDLSNMQPRKGDLPAIFKQIGRSGRGSRQSTFNFMGKLL